MEPHIEEAWRSLRVAGRDRKVVELLLAEPEAPSSIVCFHAQQAIEKSLKAVLFASRIPVERTHDLLRLARLLTEKEIAVPATLEQLGRLNPYAVAFRYDEADLEPELPADLAPLASTLRGWAEQQVIGAEATQDGGSSCRRRKSSAISQVFETCEVVLCLTEWG